MNCRRATIEDLPVIMHLVREAQAFLQQQNIDQWQDGYPSERDIKVDLEEQESFLFYEGDDILGYITVVLHPEAVYETLLEGAWINERNTEGAMHHVMISSKARGKGLSKELFALGIATCRAQGKESIRIDTHPDNLRMQHLIVKNGFKKCGVICLNQQGDLRFVYEQLIKQPE